MNRLWWLLALAWLGCSKGSPEGTYLSSAIPMEVKRQEGDRFAVTLNEDVQFSGTLEGRVLAAKLSGKDLTVEFDEAWNKATVRDGVLAREFTRVPPEELTARIEQAKFERAEEKKARKAEEERNEKRLREAEQLLAKKKYAEAKTALEGLAAEAPDFRSKDVQQKLLDAASRLAEEEQRADAGEPPPPAKAKKK